MPPPINPGTTAASAPPAAAARRRRTAPAPGTPAATTAAAAPATAAPATAAPPNATATPGSSLRDTAATKAKAFLGRTRDTALAAGGRTFGIRTPGADTRLSHRVAADELVSQWYRYVYMQRQQNPKFEGNAKDIFNFINQYFGRDVALAVMPTIRTVSQAPQAGQASGQTAGQATPGAAGQAATGLASASASPQAAAPVTASGQQTAPTTAARRSAPAQAGGAGAATGYGPNSQYAKMYGQNAAKQASAINRSNQTRYKNMKPQAPDDLTIPHVPGTEPINTPTMQQMAPGAAYTFDRQRNNLPPQQADDLSIPYQPGQEPSPDVQPRPAPAVPNFLARQDKPAPPIDRGRPARFGGNQSPPPFGRRMTSPAAPAAMPQADQGQAAASAPASSQEAPPHVPAFLRRQRHSHELQSYRLNKDILVEVALSRSAVDKIMRVLRQTKIGTSFRRRKDHNNHNSPNEHRVTVVLRSSRVMVLRRSHSNSRRSSNNNRRLM